MSPEGRPVRCRGWAMNEILRAPFSWQRAPCAVRQRPLLQPCYQCHICGYAGVSSGSPVSRPLGSRPAMPDDPG